MTPEMIGGIVRVILATFGGWLIQKGFTDSAGLEAIGGGLTVALVGLWSVIQKQRAAVKLTDAQAGVTTPEPKPLNPI